MRRGALSPQLWLNDAADLSIEPRSADSRMPIQIGKASMSKTSAALGRIQPSATLAMTGRVNELKRAGIDVIGLSAGEPDFDTPDFVKEAGIAAIRNNQTRYTTVDGTAELKDAIAAKFKRDNGLVYQPSQISVNSGGKHTRRNPHPASTGVANQPITDLDAGRPGHRHPHA